mmetsp:Transcript_16447/g.25101  ORF Transcript_16447/g.25101 Transcript_16447/m.25101 type:complete len:478 (+) Transcript_16447:57-1490(+)
MNERTSLNCFLSRKVTPHLSLDSMNHACNGIICGVSEEESAIELPLEGLKIEQHNGEDAPDDLSFEQQEDNDTAKKSVDTYQERRKRMKNNEALFDEHFILEKLSAANVTCFIIPHDSHTMLKDLQQVVIQAASQPSRKSCCVLEDTSNGKITNLLIDLTTMPSTKNFSATLALLTLMITSRSVALLFDIGSLELFRHNMVWALILGLIAYNEISESWYHVQQRGLPSEAAYIILYGNPTTHDWIRSLLLGFWIVATTIHYEHVTVSQNFTLVAMMLTIVVLSVNLGSRSSVWPSDMVASSSSSYIWAYGLAFGIGLLIPQSCHSDDPTQLLKSSVLALIGFVLSGPIFVLITQDNQYQELVNVVVLCWWVLSTIFSCGVVFSQNGSSAEESNCNQRIRKWSRECEDRHLQPSHISSPVGYTVRSLAGHVISIPSKNQQQVGANCFVNCFWCLLLPLVVGGITIFLSLNPTTKEWLL